MFGKPSPSEWIYPTESFVESTLRLRYGLESGAEMQCIEGAVGMGKSTFLSAMTAELRTAERRIHRVAAAGRTAPQLLRELSRRLGCTPELTGIADTFSEISTTVAERTACGISTLLLVDDADQMVGELTTSLGLLQSLGRSTGGGLAMIVSAENPQRLQSLPAFGWKAELLPLSAADRVRFAVECLRQCGASSITSELLADLGMKSEGSPAHLRRLCELTAMLQRSASTGDSEPATLPHLHEAVIRRAA